MKIGILGTRGIPNQYGGFEQFAEYLSAGLVGKGHEVWVYNSHTHSYQESNWNGVNIIHCYDPETRIGTAGQFVYDFNCIMNSRKQKFDVLLQLGYTSSSVWSFLLPRESLILTNMDGLEWKRSKYSQSVKKFLKWAERIAVKSSDGLIADSKGIQKYLDTVYCETSTYIPYGANVFTHPQESALASYNLVPFNYNMLIARMEPENNIELILDGVSAASDKTKFLVVGNYNNKFGTYLKNKFAEFSNINFVGAIYNLETLNNLRYYSKYYFHGHSVGGTNPSLLEAMASPSCIVAHQNEFNQAILEQDTYYFSSADDVSKLLSEVMDKDTWKKNRLNNYDKIKHKYTWSSIINQYEELFIKSIQN